MTLQPLDNSGGPAALNAAQLQRLHELLVDEQLDQLSLEDRAELDDLRAHALDSERYDGPVAELVLRSTAGGPALPADVRARLLMTGQRLMGGEAPAPLAMRAGGGGSQWVPLLMAASVLLACSTAFVAWRWSESQRALREESQRFAVAIEEVRQSNKTLLAAAQARADELAQRVATLDSASAEQGRRLAEAAAKEVKLAQDLIAATMSLDTATLKIASLETPIDPATLGQNRRKLLELPGTVRVAWQPFDLPDAPAEQGRVTGDVVWNDELEQGFVRFVGLKPNDPTKEQYQIWVIDERGMEQKVSGGVFNASADGEIVVPITPSIDVRKVALFAVTIEEPGGTVVPNLSRRVVVAPRS